MSIRKAPPEIFAGAIEYFPNVSCNLLVRNTQDELLYLKRLNQPCKNQWWFPGGRLFNGETVEQGSKRVLLEETGLEGNILAICPEYFMEVFELEAFDERDREFYSETLQGFQYFTIPVLLDVERTDVTVDDQSGEHVWSSEMMGTHPYLMEYVKMIARMGHSFPHILKK